MPKMVMTTKVVTMLKLVASTKQIVAPKSGHDAQNGRHNKSSCATKQVVNKTSGDTQPACNKKPTETVKVIAITKDVAGFKGKVRKFPTYPGS